MCKRGKKDKNIKKQDASFTLNMGMCTESGFLVVKHCDMIISKQNTHKN